MRAAMAGGCSCTLSGISQLCSLLLNSAKYRQVWRAARRRYNNSFFEASFRSGTGGRFSQAEMRLLQTQSNRIGSAAASA
jgi:hypothetical protein